MWACVASVLLTGCKPTERNYRAAYDAALAKRQAEAELRMLPASGLMSDDGPQLKIVNGDSLYVVKERLKAAPGDTLPSSGWAVGVGVYKIIILTAFSPTTTTLPTRSGSIGSTPRVFLSNTIPSSPIRRAAAICSGEQSDP